MSNEVGPPSIDQPEACEETTVWQGRTIRCRRQAPLPHTDHFGDHGLSTFGTVSWSTSSQSQRAQTVEDVAWWYPPLKRDPAGCDEGTSREPR